MEEIVPLTNGLLESDGESGSSVQHWIFSWRWSNKQVKDYLTKQGHHIKGFELENTGRDCTGRYWPSPMEFHRVAGYVFVTQRWHCDV